MKYQHTVIFSCGQAHTWTEKVVLEEEQRLFLNSHICPTCTTAARTYREAPPLEQRLSTRS